MVNKNNINNKNKFGLVILILMFFSLINIGFSNINNDNLLIDYKFEEGGGNLVNDDTNNNLDSGIDNAQFKDNNLFGNYYLQFSGSNQGTYTFNSFNLTRDYSFNFWVKLNNNYNKKVIQFDDDNYNSIFIYFDRNSNKKISLRYTNTNGFSRTIYLLNNNNLDFSFFKFVTINYNSSSNSFITYVNGQFQKKTDLTDNIQFNYNTNKMYLGYSFSGGIDNLKLFTNINLNKTYINQLYEDNIIVENDDNDDSDNDNNNNETTTTNKDIIKDNTIINYTKPIENQVVTNYDNIEVKLNRVADCDLYINNSFVKSYSGLLSFKYSLLKFDNGDYDYYLYCHYNQENKTYYQISNLTHFRLQKQIKTAEFYIYDKNNNLINNISGLYLTTPCFKKNEMSKYYEPDTPRYIQSLNNGYATFDLEYDATYEFCLVKGNINDKVNNYTLNYDVVEIEKQKDLGKIDITNTTYIYKLQIDDSDVYSVTNPTFWGETYKSLFKLIISVLIGGVFIIVGITMGSEKVIAVGGFIIAIGLGLSVTTLIGGFF